MGVEYGAITVNVVNGEVEVLVDVNGTLYCEFLDEGERYIQSMRNAVVRQIERRLQKDIDTLRQTPDVPFNGNPLRRCIENTVGCAVLKGITYTPKFKRIAYEAMDDGYEEQAQDEANVQVDPHDISNVRSEEFLQEYKIEVNDPFQCVSEMTPEEFEKNFGEDFRED